MEPTKISFLYDRDIRGSLYTEVKEKKREIIQEQDVSEVLK